MKIITKKEAKAQGLKRYFTGKPCKHGHVDERYVITGSCCECEREKSRKRYSENPEKSKEKVRKWKKENPEKNRESARKWQKENPEKAREKARKWQKENPEKHRESNRKNARKRYSENPEKSRENARKRYSEKPEKHRDSVRKWKEENHEKLAAYRAKRRAVKLQATVAWADASKIEDIYAERNRLTEETGIEHHVDHIIPLQGVNVCGLHCEHNLQVLTATENLQKSNRLLVA